MARIDAVTVKMLRKTTQTDSLVRHLNALFENAHEFETVSEHGRTHLTNFLFALASSIWEMVCKLTPHSALH